MGSVSSVPNGISLLTQPGTDVLSNLPVQLSASTLEAASPQDVVDLSASALQLQELDGILGITPSSQTPTAPIFVPSATPAVPSTTTTSSSSSTTPAVSMNPPPGVSSADLTNATPTQQTAVDAATLQQQLVQGLFYPATNLTGTTSVTG